MSGDFPVSFRYSRRAKNLRLVVKPSGVELVVPLTVGKAKALAFLRQHCAWAEHKMAELRGQAGNQFPQALKSGETVPFQGREVPLLIREVPGRGAKVHFDGQFVISVPPGPPAQARQRTRAALLTWIKVWLRDEVENYTARHTERFGLQPRQIRIKQMKSRWGSCGPRNDINLNWLLAFAPPSILEYVVVHELCHIRYRDHSAQFWQLVSHHLPDWANGRQWLKENGADLLRRLE